MLCGKGHCQWALHEDQSSSGLYMVVAQQLLIEVIRVKQTLAIMANTRCYSIEGVALSGVRKIVKDLAFYISKILEEKFLRFFSPTPPPFKNKRVFYERQKYAPRPQLKRRSISDQFRHALGPLSRIPCSEVIDAWCSFMGSCSNVGQRKPAAFLHCPYYS